MGVNRIFYLTLMPACPAPAECPIIAMKWIILIDDNYFVTEVVGMN